MSENNHSVALGAFILGAILIAASVVVFIFGNGIGSQRERVVMVFDGSVKGLSVGAPVALRGVQIGQVTDINLVLDTDNDDLIMLVEADIDAETIQHRGATPEDLVGALVDRGMRAQLNPQSLLTGLLYVLLDFHPDSPAAVANIDSPYTQIPTIPTELQKISRRLEQIDFAQVASDLRAIASGLRTVITDEQFQQLPADMQATFQSVSALSEELRASVGDSGPRLNALLDSAAITLASINTQLPRLATVVETNLDVVQKAARSFEGAMTEIDRLASEDSPTTYELNKALRELAMAGRALQLLAKTLEEQPEALLRGKSEDSP